MITTVLITYVIENRGRDSVEWTEIMKENLIDLYDAIDLDSMRMYVKNIRYCSKAEVDSEDILKIELDRRNITDVDIFRKARWIADQIGNVKKFTIERTDATNMFIGVKIGTRMTADSRKVIAPFILADIQKNRFKADSIDLDDGTVFYVRDGIYNTIQPSWELDPEAALAFNRELESVFNCHDEPTYVVMNRIEQPVYRQVNL